MKKQALGKGLKAFLPEEYGILKEERFTELDIDQIKPNPAQPRRRFDPESLAELTASIKSTGILQPVVVVPENGYFKIIVGERRWRAAQKAGLKKIPALIRNLTRVQQHEASLIENLQREDLNPIEIAQAYQKLMQDLHYTQQDLADKVGKDRTSVANYLRLLKLPPEVQDMLRQGQLSMGHARALVTLEDPLLQTSTARQIVQKKLSVRAVEKLSLKLKSSPPPSARPSMDPDLLALQERLLRSLGSKVNISGSPKKGVIKIFYYSLDELNDIYDKIRGEES